MRLTCPNCGAQYEVPDEVIPFDGRDVQCSNCGDTWFQDHPDNPQPSATAPADLEDDDAYDDAPVRKPEPDPEPEPEPEHEPEDDDDSDDEDDDAPEHGPEPRGLDGSVADVLRQEAEREARLRAGNADADLESQPDLGLEQPPNDASRRAAEARDRMSRMRGEDPAKAVQAEATASESRRGLLPDIEEINSSLKSTDKAVARPGSAAAVAGDTGRKRGGFSRGFAIAVLLIVGLILIYANAPQIARAVPQIDPVLNSYVSLVDQARLWLDTQMSNLTPDG